MRLIPWTCHHGSKQLQTTQRRYAVVLCSAVRCSASQHSKQFLVPHHTECGGLWVLSLVHSFALHKSMKAQHCSGQIPETVALYYTPNIHQGR
jgi:hypothetical protein